MTRLVYNESCRQDLASILDFIARHAPRTALRFVEEIISTCELLSTQPEMGTRRDDISKGLRLLTHRTYGIYYRYNQEEDVLRVVRILHHSRDVKRQSFE